MGTVYLNIERLWNCPWKCDTKYTSYSLSSLRIKKDTSDIKKKEKRKTQAKKKKSDRPQIPLQKQCSEDKKV